MLWSGHSPVINLVASHQRRSTAVLFWRAGAAHMGFLMQAQLQFSVNMESSFWSLDGWLEIQLSPVPVWMDTYNFRTVLHSWCSAVVLYIYISLKLTIFSSVFYACQFMTICAGKQTLQNGWEVSKLTESLGKKKTKPSVFTGLPSLWIFYSLNDLLSI